MKKLLFVLLTVHGIINAFGQMVTKVSDPVEWANPLMGTDSKPSLLASGIERLAVDFNPSVDRLRVIGSSGQNYRINPNDGSLLTDSPLSYAAGDMHAGMQPQVFAVAYTNNIAATPTTTLYYYDYALDKIGIINPPNGGVLNTVGSSGIVTGSGTSLDLDISTNSSAGVNTAFLSANVMGTASNFYTVDLSTGETSILGTISASITEMAVSLTDVVTLLNNATIVLNTTCGLNDGNISIIPLSGTPPFMYSIDGGTTYIAGPITGLTFPGLGIGTYNLRLKDANGNESAIVTRNVVQQYGILPTFLNNLQIVLDATCGQNDGNISIIPLSGTPPFMYSINGGATYVSGPNAGMTFTGLAAGTYQLRLRSAGGCESAIVTRTLISRYGNCGPVAPSAENNSEIIVSASPNPSRGRVSVRLMNFTASKAEILILDSKGNVVDRNRVSLSKEKLANFDLSNHPSGLYIIKVISVDGIHSSKILIQR